MGVGKQMGGVRVPDAVPQAGDVREGEAVAVVCDDLSDRNNVFRLIVENVPDVLWIMDENYRCTYVNKAVFALYGYTAEEAVNVSMVDTTPPESLARLNAAMEKRLNSIASGQPDHSPYVLELQQYKKDGTLFWIETNTIPYVDASGCFRGVIGSSRDITDKKRAEAALARRVAMEHLIGEIATGFLGISSEQADASILDALAVIGKLTKSDCVFIFLFRGQSPISDFVYEWNAPGIEPLQQRLQGINVEVAGPLFWETIRKGDSYYIPDVAALPEDLADRRNLESWNVRSLLAEPLHLNGDLVGYLGFSSIKDLHFWAEEDQDALRLFSKSLGLLLERRRVEDALLKSRDELAENEAKLDLAMQIAHIGLWEFDLQNMAFLFNDQFYSLYATTAEREGGYVMSQDTYCRELVHPEDWGIVNAEDGKVTAPGTSEFYQQMEHRIVRRDGVVRYIVVRYMLLRNSENQHVKIIGVNQDITERKQIEESLLAARQAAECSNKAKSEFLANMSHEIRTPLNGIMGTLQLLELCDLNSEALHYTAIAMTSGKRLARLLGDILDLSRIEAGRLNLEVESFSVRELLDSVVNLFGLSADQAGLSLRTSMDTSIPRLLGDSNRVLQVLNNLVGNALKFTEQGSVDVDVYRLPENKPGTCRVCFEVSDTGIGIPDDKLAQLFRPFTQADAGFTRQHQGAGLGLSIAKRLIDLMGGNISVVSDREEGTTMLFCVPFPVDAGHRAAH